MPKRSLFLLSLLSGLAACDRQPSAPVDPADEPALNWMNNPDNGNLRIQRFQEHFATSWTDPGNGLRATHTTFPIPFMGLPELDCGPQSDLAPIDVQDVGLIDAIDLFSSQIRRNMAGPVWIIVRDVTQAGDCYGVRLVAEGIGSVRYTDNDIFGVGPEANNANAWGFGAKGSLTSVDGGTLSYTGHARFTVVIKPGQDPEFVHEQLVVNVR